MMAQDAGRENEMGSPRRLASVAGAALMVLLAMPAAAQQKHEFKYALGPGGSLTIVNGSGPVTVRPASGKQTVVVVTKQSDKIEIDEDNAGNRVQLRTHALERQTGDQARVQYDVSVPAGVSLRVIAAGGPITVEKVRGNLSLEGDSARIEVKDVSNAHVQVRTMSGVVSLSNVSGGEVEITSVAGDIELNNVSGRRVAANSTKGNIRYAGAFTGGGDYILTNHSGNIDLTLAPNASVDLTAHSVTGSVQNDYPMQLKPHAFLKPSEGRSYAGTSQRGEASVQLRSFSGKIRVKQQ
jgi:hypothetical protein